MAVHDQTNYPSTFPSQPAPLTNGPTAPVAPAIPLASIRAPPLQQHRPPTFSGYLSQADYVPYYTGNVARESFSEYPYQYESYRPNPDPNLFGTSPPNPAPLNSVYPSITSQPLHALPEIHNATPPMYYDYANINRPPASPYYYPNQPIVYHAHPAHNSVPGAAMSSLVPHSISIGVKDKKRGLQVR